MEEPNQQEIDTNPNPGTKFLMPPSGTALRSCSQAKAPTGLRLTKVHGLFRLATSCI